MLTQLRVENYAVIDKVTVEFEGGLNLLTGETGAGKSILVDALSLLLGEKASSDIVRHGTERATVSGVFALQRATGRTVAGVLEANGIDAQDEEVIVRREMQVSGKGRVFINNQPATLGVLKKIAPHLAFVHAQNETLANFDGDERRKLLDGFAGVDTTRCGELFREWQDLKRRIEQLQSDEQERLRQVDLWRFQRNEIDSAALVAGEDERLETERRVLQNAEKLYAAANAAFEVLYEEDHSAAAAVRSAQRHVDELARFDGRFAEAAQGLASAKAAIEDVAAMARDYAEKIDASPERLAQIEDRLAAIHLLKRKYGASVGEIMRYAEELREKLSEVENRDEILSGLNAQLTAVAAAYAREARAVSEKRRQAAGKLAAVVERNVNELAMKVRFSVELTSEESDAAWTSHGWDAIEFLIATNSGEPMKPLQQIASGGELSRVMLALKAAVFESKKQGGSSLRTLVFDEIDTGIGGRAAEAVGQKLKQLARSHQVLCITHLPQIASMADRHYVIEKRSNAGRTVTNVRAIAGRERTEEIARMLSGAQLTTASIANAEQMLRMSAGSTATN